MIVTGVLADRFPAELTIVSNVLYYRVIVTGVLADRFPAELTIVSNVLYYRVIVTGVLADRFPAEQHLFRSYHPTLDKPVKTTGSNATFEEIKAPNGMRVG